MAEVKPLPPLDPHMDASKNHYWTYHSLENLLACKRPLTASKDEDLFIAVHQICELAFHQMTLDLERALDALQAALQVSPPEPGQLAEAAYFLERVNAFWRVVTVTMPTLAGMRAFAEFRTSIGPTSGFQSMQFRRLEIMSGVDTHYWAGGTADAEGRKHVAETRFDEVYGEQVRSLFKQHADHNLKVYGEALLKAGEGASSAVRGQLLRALADYDAAQLAFHRAHLGMAATQLKKVGVDVGTGGTSFKTYLAKYESLHAPLFPSLVEQPPGPTP